jgi:hypothetical protein
MTSLRFTDVHVRPTELWWTRVLWTSHNLLRVTQSPARTGPVSAILRHPATCRITEGPVTSAGPA